MLHNSYIQYIIIKLTNHYILKLLKNIVEYEIEVNHELLIH